MKKEQGTIDQFAIYLYFQTVVLEKMIGRILYLTNSTMTQEDINKIGFEMTDLVEKIPFNENLNGMKRLYEKVPFDPTFAKFNLKEELFKNSPSIN